MKIQETIIPGVLLIEPAVFHDERGYFWETYQAHRYTEAGVELPFVQDNHSRSMRDVLRGLHYQREQPQGKLVSVIRGEIFDVAVDLRRSSRSFGQWFGVTLSAENHRQLYIPPHLAHGFCVLSDLADVVYKCTDLYDPRYERTIRWDDPNLAIDWPLNKPILSGKDAGGDLFSDAEYFS